MPNTVTALISKSGSSIAPWTIILMSVVNEAIKREEPTISKLANGDFTMAL